MGRFFDIVLIFAATMFGIWTCYAAGSGAIVTWLFVIVVTGLLCRLAAELLGRTRPTTFRLLLAVPLIYAAVAVNFAAIALTSWFTLTVTLRLKAELAKGGLLEVPADDAATVSTLVIGAITGFLGAAFYDEAKKPDSALWPPQIFKKYLEDVFGGHPHITGQATPELYALLYADAPGHGVKGWRFPAALLRAALIGPRYARVPPRPARRS